ncbi:unnamed protein product [Gadus morhua 'NCC']
MLSLAARAGSPSGSESPAHNVCPDPAVSRTVARYASSALGSRSERGGLLLWLGGASLQRTYAHRLAAVEPARASDWPPAPLASTKARSRVCPRWRRVAALKAVDELAAAASPGVGAGLERSPVHPPQNSDLLLYRKVLWEPVPDCFPAAAQGCEAEVVSGQRVGPPVNKDPPKAHSSGPLAGPWSPPPPGPPSARRSSGDPRAGGDAAEVLGFQPSTLQPELRLSFRE